MTEPIGQQKNGLKINLEKISNNPLLQQRKYQSTRRIHLCKSNKSSQFYPIWTPYQICTKKKKKKTTQTNYQVSYFIRILFFPNIWKNCISILYYMLTITSFIPYSIHYVSILSNSNCFYFIVFYDSIFIFTGTFTSSIHYSIHYASILSNSNYLLNHLCIIIFLSITC